LSVVVVSVVIGASLRAERERLAAEISQLPNVIRVWPSEANFLLVESTAPEKLVAAAKCGGVLIRDFSWDPFTKDCLRITVGSITQNDQLLTALSKQE